MGCDSSKPEDGAAPPGGGAGGTQPPTPVDADGGRLPPPGHPRPGGLHPSQVGGVATDHAGGGGGGAPPPGSPARSEPRVQIPRDYNPGEPGLTPEQQEFRRKQTHAFLKGARSERPLVAWKDARELPEAERQQRKGLREAYGRGRRTLDEAPPSPDAAGGGGPQLQQPPTTRPPAVGGLGSAKGAAPPGGVPPKGLSKGPPVQQLSKTSSAPPQGAGASEAGEEEAAAAAAAEAEAEAAAAVEEEELRAKQEEAEEKARAFEAQEERIRKLEAALEERRSPSRSGRGKRQRGGGGSESESGFHDVTDGEDDDDDDELQYSPQPTRSPQQKHRQQASGHRAKKKPAKNLILEEESSASRSSLDDAHDAVSSVASSRPRSVAHKRRARSETGASVRSEPGAGERSSSGSSIETEAQLQGKKKKQRSDKKRGTEVEGDIRRELQEGLQVYTIQREIAPEESVSGRVGADGESGSGSDEGEKDAREKGKAEGYLYGVDNQSVYGAVVTLSFAGSQNIRVELTEAGRRNGAALRVTDDGIEVETPEVHPKTMLFVLSLRPENAYAPFTVSAVSKWSLLQPVYPAAAAFPNVPQPQQTLYAGGEHPRSVSHSPSVPAYRGHSFGPAGHTARSTEFGLGGEPGASHSRSQSFGMPYAPEQAPAGHVSPVRARQYLPPSQQQPQRRQESADDGFGRQPSQDHTSYYTVEKAERELDVLQKERGGQGSGRSTRAAPLSTVAVAKGLPFVDGDFMPSDTVSEDVKARTTGWVRVEKLTRQDVVSSLYPADGFRWNVAAIPKALRWYAISLSLMLDVYPDAVSALFPAIVSPDAASKRLSNVGGYEAWWCTNGWWTKCTTDSYIPQPPLLDLVVHDTQAGKKRERKTAAPKQQYWADLILKSYAKVRLGYANAVYGIIGHFLQAATGCPYKRIPLCYAADEMRQLTGPRGRNDNGQDGDLCVLWDDIKTHVDCGRLLAVSKEESVEARKQWRGDCDFELQVAQPLAGRVESRHAVASLSRAHHFDREGSARTQRTQQTLESLVALPEDTSLPVIGYSEDYNDICRSKLKLRNRFGERADGGGEDDCWVEYGDLLRVFSSLTISYVTPGWNDLRWKIRPDENNSIFDTFFEVYAPSCDTQLHLWLGSVAESACLLGALILQAQPNNRTSSMYTCIDVMGVENSAHIWTETVLPADPDAPYIIVPLFLNSDAYDGRSRGANEFVTMFRTPEAAGGKGGVSVNARANTEELVKSCELEAILEKGELRVIGEEEPRSARKVSLRLLQQYRWLGCAVTNSSHAPAEIRVDLSGSEGYRVVHTGRGVARNGFVLSAVVPPYSAVLLCTLVSDADSWEYTLGTSCQWLSGASASVMASHPAPIVPTAHPLVARETQINGDAQIRQNVKL